MLEAYGKEINGILLSMFPVMAVRREAGQDRWRSDPGQQISFPVAPTERKSFPRGLCVCVWGGVLDGGQGCPPVFTLKTRGKPYMGRGLQKVGFHHHRTCHQTGKTKATPETGRFKI